MRQYDPKSYSKLTDTRCRWSHLDRVCHPRRVVWKCLAGLFSKIYEHTVISVSCTHWIQHFHNKMAFWNSQHRTLSEYSNTYLKVFMYNPHVSPGRHNETYLYYIHMMCVCVCVRLIWLPGWHVYLYVCVSAWSGYLDMYPPEWVIMLSTIIYKQYENTYGLYSSIQ